MISQETFQTYQPHSIETIKKTRHPVQKQYKRFPSFQTVHKISKAKFSVYLIYCESLNQYFAMKVFPYRDGKANPHFLSETRFTCLDHPNVIKLFNYEKARETVYQGNIMITSYIIMEYARFGDFYDIVAVRKLLFDDRMVRTYFHQLVEGLEYLHSRKIAHLDLKLENLLLGRDFKLKIADFDLAYVEGDSRVTTRGTRFYRAPELSEQKCKNVEAADIYSLGILLFVFKTGGILPHSEMQLYKGINLFKLLHENNKVFWQKHCEIQEKTSYFFDLDFKNLFNSLVRINPSERSSIADIKKSKWYNGPVYTQEELIRIMSKLF